jgi:glutathione S-transferase
MRLYRRDNAGRPPRVRWALGEVGAPYELVELTLEETKQPPHRARHPLGRVPVLETDDGMLFESAAICLQVADLYPEAELIPPVGSHERGLVYQWVVFAMSELEPSVLGVYRAEEAGRTDDLPALSERLAETYDALEQALTGREHLVGDRFTIADVVIGGVLYTARRRELHPTSPNLAAYLERLDRRPAKHAAYDW